jgi:hypothetical protein
MDEIEAALRPLVDHPPAAPPPLDEIRARARRRRMRRRAVGGAALAAAVVAVAVPVWELRQPDRTSQLATIGSGTEGPAGTDTANQPGGPDVAEAPPPTTGAGSGDAAAAEEQRSDQGGDPVPQPAPSSLTIDPTPPWSAAPLPAAEAAATVEAWNADPYARECPALAPDDLGEGAGATPRVADRGLPGSWWIEYDLPGAPGEADIQLPSADAGRATFFVSATIGAPGYEFPVTEESINSWPNVHHWSDGSSVGWGVAGRGTLQETNPEWPTHWLAYMELEGSRCFYQVGSYLSEEHLIFLLGHLRFVEGAP